MAVPSASAHPDRTGIDKDVVFVAAHDIDAARRERRGCRPRARFRGYRAGAGPSEKPKDFASCPSRGINQLRFPERGANETDQVPVVA